MKNPIEKVDTMNLEPFRDEILLQFKQNILDVIARQQSVDSIEEYNHLIEMTMTQLGVEIYGPEQLSFLKEWFEKIINLNFLRDLLANESLQEIICHDSTTLYSHFHHGWETSSIKLDQDDYKLAWERLAYHYHQDWNFSNPFASFQVTLHGFKLRCTLIHGSCQANGFHQVFLRKQSHEIFPSNPILVTIH